MYFDIRKLDVKDFRLEIEFADGLHGIVHINKSWLTGVFTPLQDENLFRTAFLKHGAVTWDIGAEYELDLAPDTMYEEIKNNNGVYIMK